MKKLVSTFLVLCMLVFPEAQIAKADTGLKLQSYNITLNDATNNINFQLNLLNTGSTAISLSDVTLRYYFTMEGSQSTNYACDYTPVGSSNVRGSFGNTSDSRYLELGFSASAGNLAPGASLPMYIRIWKSDWTNFSQSNDYSFHPTAKNLTDTNKITGYIKDFLVCGKEPGTSVSTPTPTSKPNPTVTPVPTTKPNPTATPVPTVTATPNAKSAFSQIQAEDYDSRNASNIQTFRLNEGGSAIGYIENGNAITFKNIDFGMGASSVTFRAATQMYSTSIQIRANSTNGTLLGTLFVPSTGSWDSYQEISTNINTTTGVKDIVLVFSGAVNVDFFKFNNNGGSGDIGEPTPTPWKPTPTPTDAPTPTPWMPNPTPVPGKTMKEISDDYMKNINIAIECPSNNSAHKSNVAYGSVVNKTYYSTTTRSNRKVNIILPANYNSSKRYPVLYVLHGIMGNEDSMLDGSNHLVDIVGNQIANGNAKEMIVVCPNMYASADGTPAGMTVQGMLGYDNFINDLVDNLMPFMEKNYSILTDRKYQAICGFSMGGREALFIGITRPDLFGYCMGIAPAPGLTPGRDFIADHPGQLSESDLRIKNVNDTPYAIMICAGTNDSVVGTFPESYHNILTRNNQNHIWYSIPGADHDARTIQSGLNNFVAAIFHADD
ncbi:MAG: carbohydrate-binding protein [Clostridiales bacterium]|nr:carbohydrate-binding protein [Clostridiales bacterium]